MTAEAPTTTTPDLRPFLAAALDQMESLITDLGPGQADLRTPCDEYDVAGLINHLQGVIRRIGVVLSGEPFWTAPSEVASTDWKADWRSGRAATEEVLRDDAVLTRQVTVPWGTVPGAGAIGSYVGELTVHAWDLARATGQTSRLNPALAEGALPAYQQMLPAEARGGDIPFGAVVEVDPDAGPYERLVAWTGRDPRWTA